MTRALHAEIAGGGLAALTAGIRLAHLGWTVRIHERSDAIRDSGSGIYIWENGLRVLEALGAHDDTVAGAVAGKGSEFRGRGGASFPRMPASVKQKIRLYSIPRQQLLSALLKAARKAGVEVVLGSEAVGAEPDGHLRLAGGARLGADLVIGADGVYSKVRDALGLLSSFEEMQDGAVRAMIPRLSEDGDDRYVEHWSGARRILVTPVSRHQVYLALTCLHTDEAARSVPLRKDVWTESFPHLESMIGRISEARWDRFVTLKLRSWAAGNVAVLGDAAHAMTPNLGQGGGMAMQNAFSLATEMGTVGSSDEVPEALNRWEARERALTEHTQTWSWLYGFLTTWPDDLRLAAMAAAGTTPWLVEQRFRTAQSIPYGTEGNARTEPVLERGSA